MKIHRIVPAVLALLALAPAARADKAPVVTARLPITHNSTDSKAFTDLIQYGKQLFLCYREGTDKTTFDGKIQIITSLDAIHWYPAATITGAVNEDLRVPHLSIRPSDGALLLNVDARTMGGDFYTKVWVSKTGFSWFFGGIAGDDGFWLWSIVWNKGKAYSIGAAELGSSMERLYTSTDGITWTTLVHDLFDVGSVSDADLVFTGDGAHAYCIIRRDPAIGMPDTAVLGASNTPFTHWTFKDLGFRFNSPRLYLKDNTHLFAAGRQANLSPLQTNLDQIDPTRGVLLTSTLVDQNNDTGYPGLVHLKDGSFLMSYYSGQTNGPSDIFLAFISSGH